MQTERQALDTIAELCRPGQEMSLSKAIDLICDIYNAARGTYVPSNSTMVTKEPPPKPRRDAMMNHDVYDTAYVSKEPTANRGGGL
jgi:hypothetical protein